MKRLTDGKKVEYKTQEEILLRGDEAIGKTIRQIDKYGRVDSDGIKGGIGHVIEESWYGYNINSDAEPDFKEAGDELKVTGLIKDKTGYRAKERLVLNIINYMEEAYTTFDTSSFWHKNKVSLENMTTEPSYSDTSTESKELMAVVMKLPKNYSTVIHLYYYEGYDVKEISKILGITESNVQIRLMRARNKLKSILKEA